jgi:hypothetical protein
MFHRKTRSASAALDSANLLEMNGLSAEQEQACYDAREGFLARHRLTSWGLNVNLGEDGPATWRLDLMVVASADFDRQIRSSHITVDKTFDLGDVVDLCLETHYNTCMNRKSISQSFRPRSEDRGSHFLFASA